jgi:integrase
MPSLNLTDRRVKSLSTDKVQEEFYDTLVPGLILRVGKGGTRAWAVRYRAGGKHRRLGLGKYPNLSLADARERARAKLAAAQDGEDPALERAIRRSKDTTFAALASEVMEVKASGRDPVRPATLRQYRQILDAELLPAWKDRPVTSITRRDVIQLVDRIHDRAPVQANRTLATIKVLFNEGLSREFPSLEYNPAHRVKLSDEAGRDRYLDRKEIKAVWHALDHEAPVWRVLYRLAMLTGQRMGNLCAMRWSDINGADVWRIPAAQFKGKREHWVPLSPEALAVLEEMRTLTGGMDHVFPGRTGAKLPHVTNYNNALVRIRDRTKKIPAWNPHDLRTTLRTWATRAEKPGHKGDPAGCGVAPHIADAVLGHAEVSLGFRRYTGDAPAYLLAEKRDALARWGRFVAVAVKEVD